MTQPLDFAISLALLAIGGWMLWSLISIMLEVFFKNSQAAGSLFGKTSPLKQVAPKSPKKEPLPSLDKFDELVKADKPKKAFKELVSKLGLKSAPGFEDLSSEKEFHQVFLDRLLNLADSKKIRLDNIGNLESLLAQFADLNDQLAKASLSFKNLEKRRTASGKALPDWSKKDFKDRIRDIKTERNELSGKLAEELENTRKTLLSGKPQEKDEAAPTLH